MAWSFMDPAKALLLRFMELYAKQHGTSIDAIELSLRTTPDPVVRALYDATEEANSQVANEWQRKAFRTFRNVLLGIFYKDLAYHDQGAAMLRSILLRAPAILPHLPGLPPSDWHINRFAAASKEAEALGEHGASLRIYDEARDARLLLDIVEREREGP